MILVFLIIFGILAFAIMEELEKEPTPPMSLAGNCPECGYPTESDWLLCPGCRTLLKSVCETCGRTVAHSHHYCTHCGTPRSKEGR